MFLVIKAYAEGWVTINGVHVYIDYKGTVKKGPSKFVGSNINDLNKSKSTADKKAELQKKYRKKSESPVSANTGNSTFDRAFAKCHDDDLTGSVHRDTKYNESRSEFLRDLEAGTLPWQLKHK